jgi:hypothetical protein
MALDIEQVTEWIVTIILSLAAILGSSILIATTIALWKDVILK